MVKDIRTLRADEIEVRVGTAKSGGKGASFLLYKDARCDMAILDEVFGADNWQRDHKELKGNIYCGVSINVGTADAPRWVTKWDAGAESNTEAVKGEASDSFKRACFNWGIGRELYTSPFIWISGDPDKLKYARLQVVEIGYNNKREIDRLVIIDTSNNQTVYTYGTKKAATQPKAVQQLQQQLDGKQEPTTVEKIEACKTIAEFNGIWNKLSAAEQSDNEVRKAAQKKCAELKSNNTNAA